MKLPLPACLFDDSLDEPGYSPSSATAEAAEALAALGVIEVLGYVATPWLSTRIGNVLELVDRKGGRLVVRWSGRVSAHASVTPGTLAEMTGRWALVEHQLVLDVDDILAVDGPAASTM